MPSGKILKDSYCTSIGFNKFVDFTCTAGSKTDFLCCLLPCAISSEMLMTALRETVGQSFNRISVDGDTSTNDSCMVLANGLAGNAEITEKGDAYIIDSNQRLRFHKSTDKTGKTSSVASNVADMTFRFATNTLYYSSSEEMAIYSSENGSQKPTESIKFDSTALTDIPVFANSVTKKAYVAFYDEATDNWKLFYTLGGSSFKLVASGCAEITGITG